MSTRRRRSRQSLRWGAAGAGLLVCGVAAIVMALLMQQSPPQPPASAAVSVAVTPDSSSLTSARGPSSEHTTATSALSVTARHPATRSTSTQQTTPEPTAATRSTAADAAQVLPRSKPVSLSIPAIHVNKSLKKIGLTADHHIVTPPLVKDSHPFWLTASPTPGELGPSVILGHIDSAHWGPAIFFNLGKLRQHDKISVTRADGTVAVFKVTHVNEYKKAQFPTQDVYGNIDHAGLRLMTCGGTFNRAKRSYESNIVVYAELVSSHQK